VLRDYQERLEVSPGRLDEIESRLALVERLKKKYGSSVDEVLAFGARCRGELQALLSPEQEQRKLEERRDRAAAAYLERARALSKRRRSIARELVRRVQAELGELAMEKTRFEVLFTPASADVAAADPSLWTEQGLEGAEFLLSPNPGESCGRSRASPRAASCRGSCSRSSRWCASDAAGLTLVFDEVDAGIGGRVAEVVGRKLRALADKQQVLCVTHLPQIAAFADNHIAVRKQVARGRTETGVDSLSDRERVEEVRAYVGGRDDHADRAAARAGDAEAEPSSAEIHLMPSKEKTRYFIQTFGLPDERQRLREGRGPSEVARLRSRRDTGRGGLRLPQHVRRPREGHDQVQAVARAPRPDEEGPSRAEGRRRRLCGSARGGVAPGGVPADRRARGDAQHPAHPRARRAIGRSGRTLVDLDRGADAFDVPDTITSHINRCAPT
jgi:hypothetical protein